MDDVEGKPARILRYPLVRRDFLAYEMAAQEMDWRMKLVLVAFVSTGGLVASLFPRDMAPALWWFLVIAAVGAGAVGAVVYSNVAIRRRAARHAVPGTEMVLEEWDDRLVERSGGRDRRIGFDTIARVTCNGAHVFVRGSVPPVIVPRCAFASDGDMHEFAAKLDDAARRARP